MPHFLKWCQNCDAELHDESSIQLCRHCEDEYCNRCISDHERHCPENEDENEDD